MKKVFEAKIELPMKFASGNQMMVARKRLIRTKEYHAYHDYLKASLEEILDEVQVQMKPGQAYEIRSLFIYPVPKSLISSKKKRDEFDSSKVLPITRGTIDIDNSVKASDDVLQEVLGFDDSQIVNNLGYKRYWLGETYIYKFELYEFDSGMEIEFYD